MGFGNQAAAAIARARETAGEIASPALDPSVDPWAPEFTADAADRNFPELDCVRRLLPREVIRAAEHRAEEVGVGVDRVLIAAGALTEESYLRALGESLGVAFEPLDGIARDQCPIDDERLIEAVAAGMLPLADDDELCLVVAPRGAAARKILRLIESNPARARRFRFTSAERLNRFVLRYAGQALAARAADSIKRKWPILSAGAPRWLGNLMPLAIMATLVSGAAMWAPVVTKLGFELMLAAVFLAWLALRLAGVCVRPVARDASSDIPKAELPVYTVIAALYREAASIDGLLSAIERLDYPPEKLDVILAIEGDDRETRAAIAARKSRVPPTVVIVPSGGPRTKPKALNVALPFARGTFTVIYDAEDRPDPDQLLDALQAFRAGSDDLACVQARLSIDNTADGWLARLFTAEYAGQFDVFLPGVATLRLPVPLGGSSNHFRTAILREVGGWDAYNVTEDADLGMRLARFGYRTGVIASTTYEEAPARLRPWLRQRTRWFKGWIQTWLVHMRQPRILLRELGLPGFVTFQLIVGGNALAALVHPLFLAGLIYSMANGAPMWRGESPAVAILAALYGTTALIGYLTSAFLCTLGLARRGLLSTAWILLLTPLHWLLLSLASWRALYQLIVSPYAWEKTEHGLAKTSRRAGNRLRSLLELERLLRELQENGELPTVNGAATYTSANRRPLPPAAA